MAQTSYSINQDVAFLGMKADSRYDFVATGIAEGVIPFAKGLKRGTDTDYEVLVIDNVADVFHGVSLYEESQTSGNYPDTKPVNVLREGAVWVNCTVAVNGGQAAYVDVATGDFTNVSTGNVATGGTFRDTIAGAGLNVIEFKLP